MKYYLILAALLVLKLSSIRAQQCPPAYSNCNLGKEGFVNVHLVAHTHDDVG